MKEILDETFPTKWTDLNGVEHDEMDHSDELLDGYVERLSRGDQPHLLRDAATEARQKEMKKSIAVQMGTEWKFKDETIEAFKKRKYPIVNDETIKQIKASSMGFTPYQYKRHQEETNPDHYNYDQDY